MPFVGPDNGMKEGGGCIGYKGMGGSGGGIGGGQVGGSGIEWSVWRGSDCGKGEKGGGGGCSALSGGRGI